MLRFALLGPLEVRRDGVLVDLGPRRHVELLCLLLVRPRTVVTAETLADELWDGRPPATAANTLQGYVAGLRRALEPDRAPRQPARVLVTHALGYSLEVADDALDLAAFREAVAAGRSAGDVDMLRAALALWRGPALADVADAGWAAPVRGSLEEERLAAEDLVASLVLASGADVADVVPPLQRRLAAHPLRERTAVLLMRALYREGRQAEALDVGRATRERLADELGIDPGPDLRQVELAILRQDDSVLRPARRPTRSVGAAEAASVPGRGDELSRLLEAADLARSGTTAAVLVTGEPGIGKTRLVEGLVASLADARVLMGRCSDLEGTPAYWPWRQALSLVGGGPAAGDSRFEQALALAGRLREDAAEQPVVVVLEDLQWADGPSLELVELVLAEVRDARVLLVLTARGPVVDARLTRVLAALGRHPRTTRIELESLDGEAIAAAVAEVTAVPPAPEVVAEIEDRSGGNPFLARELARLLGPDGRLRAGVPAAVRDVLRLRTSVLPGPARDLLAAGAVLGRDFAERTAVAMLDLQQDDTLAALEATLDAGLLVQPLAGRLRFSHALVHEAVRADLSSARAVGLHARAARALSEREHPPAGVLAHHLLHAREEAGVETALEAAEQDLRQLAAEPALELLDLADGVAADLAVRTDTRERLALLRGIALARLGRLDESLQVLVATAEAAAERDDHDLLARAALAMAADGSVAGYWTMLAPVTGDPDRVVRWLRQALDALADDELAVAVRSSLATQLAMTGRPDPALADRAVADAAGLAADHRTRALTARWASLWTPAHATERLGIARLLVELAGRHVQRRLAARHLLTTALLETGDLTGSDAEFAALAAEVERLRDPDFALLVVWWRAMRALMRGDLAAAEATASELEARLDGAGGQAAATAMLSLGTVSGIVAWERGLLGQATADLDAQGFTQHPGMQVVRALAHAQAGDAATAHRVLDQVLGPDLARLGDDPVSVSPLVLAVEALAVAGDGGQASALLERLTPYAGSVVVFAPGAVCMGAGTLYTGTAAALVGDLDRALADLTDAVRRNEALGATPFAIRSLTRLAWVLEQRGDRVGAAGLRARADRLAGSVGLSVAAFAG